MYSFYLVFKHIGMVTVTLKE